MILTTALKKTKNQILGTQSVTKYYYYTRANIRQKKHRSRK